MTRLISALSDISADYDVLYCDIWGCVHNGVAAYPAAIAALQAFRARGGRVALLTNAPRPAAFVAQSLAALNVPTDAWDVIVTSGDAAQDAMFAGAVGRKVWHLGPEKDEGFFAPIPADWADAPAITRVALEEAEGIIATGPFDELTETPEDYRARLTAARDRGLPLLCANPDLVVDLGERRIYCAGALAAFYAELGGRSLYFGKPWAPIYDLARRRLGLGETGGRAAAPGARVLAIGDGIATDISGARAAGVDALFVTGGLAAERMGPDVEAPEAAALTAYLAETGEAPAFAIGRLR